MFNNATKVQSFFELQTHFIYFLSLYFLVSTFFSTFAQVFKTEKNFFKFRNNYERYENIQNTEFNLQFARQSEGN